MSETEDAQDSNPPETGNEDAPLQPESPTVPFNFDLPSSEPSTSPPDQAFPNLENADPWFPFLSKPHMQLCLLYHGSHRYLK